MRILLLLFGPTLALAQTGVPVTTQPLTEVLVERALSAPAEVVSANRASIAAEVSAVIAEIHADVGQSVEQGQPLLTLDAADYQLALDQARANLASNAARIKQAEIRLQRAKELSDKQYIAADDLLARETDVVVLKAERKALEVAVASAKRNMAKCAIEAPFNGVVTERAGQVGSFVAIGAPLVTFVETDQIEVDAEIPAHLADSLSQASELSFASDGRQWPVTVDRLSPVIEPGLRAQRARLQFTASAAPIGLSGELNWRIEGGLLPADLIVRRDGQSGVFVANNDIAQFILLSNAQEGRPVPVSLPADTTVIVGGRERLQDGDAIRVGQ